MDELFNNTSCRLYGTPHCLLLNAQSCSKCYVAKLHPEEQEMVREDIRLIADNIPDDGLEALENSDTCCLCKGRNKNKASYYAHFTLAHLHPTAAYWRSGRRGYRRDTSLTIPVQLAACSECRRRVFVNALVPLFVGIVIAALGLVAVSLESVRTVLVRGGKAIPFLVFLIFVFLGIIAEALLKSKFTRELERRTYMRHSRLPVIGDMIKRGWIDLSDDGDAGYTFTKRPLSNGILTGRDRAELIRQIRSDETMLPAVDPAKVRMARSGAAVRPAENDAAEPEAGGEELCGEEAHGEPADEGNEAGSRGEIGLPDAEDFLG